MAKTLTRITVAAFALAIWPIVQADPEAPHIHVSGAGAVEVTPDTARVDVELSEIGKDLEAQKEAVDRKTRRLLEVAETIGIQDRDIDAAQVFIHPEYQWEEQRRRFVGYRVARAVNLTLRELEHYPALINGIVEAGASNLPGVQFDVSNREALEEKALRRAIRSARATAEAMAEESGVAIQGVYRITERGTPRPVMMQSRAMEADDTYRPGALTIEREVEMVFLTD